MRSNLCVAAVAAASIALGTFGANAMLISPDGASASSQHSGSYDPGNTIDGSGLPANFTAADAHADYAANNHWTAASGDLLNAWITWTFNTPQTLSSIVIWNHLSNGPAGNPGYEPTLFDLTIRDSSNNTLLFWDDVALAPDTATGQTFSFGGSIAGISSVRFDVEAVQSSTSWTGLAEVAFDDTRVDPVPVAPALPLLATGLAGMALLRKTRKQQP